MSLGRFLPARLFWACFWATIYSRTLFLIRSCFCCSSRRRSWAIYCFRFLFLSRLSSSNISSMMASADPVSTDFYLLTSLITGGSSIRADRPVFFGGASFLVGNYSNYFDDGGGIVVFDVGNGDPLFMWDVMTFSF